MLSKIVASIRDMQQAHPIASEAEERWLSNLWHGALHVDNQQAEWRIKKMQWFSVFFHVAVLLVFVVGLAVVGGIARAGI